MANLKFWSHFSGNSMRNANTKLIIGNAMPLGSA
jgi:hypothetical protein